MKISNKISSSGSRDFPSQSIVFSVVSHGQLGLIRNLLEDFRSGDLLNMTIVLTINIPEDEYCLEQFSDLRIRIIRNMRPKGFGDNHNQAFKAVACDFFVVVNPDIRLPHFSLHALVEPLEDKKVGAVAPRVLSPDGNLEDSVRRYPTFQRLFKRVVLRKRSPEYRSDRGIVDVDWAAGMFIVFRQEAFDEIGGFDTRYFMYMEDADVCRRLKHGGWRIVLQPATSVVHDAQRASRRSLRHLRWHMSSAIRFLFAVPKKA